VGAAEPAPPKSFRLWVPTSDTGPGPGRIGSGGELPARTGSYRPDLAVPSPLTADTCNRKRFTDLAEQGYPNAVRDINLTRLYATRFGPEDKARKDRIWQILCRHFF